MHRQEDTHSLLCRHRNSSACHGTRPCPCGTKRESQYPVEGVTNCPACSALRDSWCFTGDSPREIRNQDGSVPLPPRHPQVPRSEMAEGNGSGTEAPSGPLGGGISSWTPPEWVPWPGACGSCLVAWTSFAHPRILIR